MIVQVITFESKLSEDEVWSRARERLERFRELDGLVQKYYVRGDAPNRYGGVYVWDSKESLEAYRQSDLAASIREAYDVVGQPDIQVLDAAFALREHVAGG